MRYSPRQLVHLAAIAEAGSFSLAAHRLGLTQPALTKSIQQLEARVGASLIRRTARGAKLTDLGQTLAGHGLNIIASTQRAEEDADDWARARRGQLIVGAPATISAYLMPTVISEFLALHPDIFLKLLVAPLDTLPLKLTGNMVDLYIGNIRMDEDLSHLNADPLYGDELTIFVRDGHPLLALPNPTVADLAAYQWAVLPTDKFFRRLADMALLGSGLPTMRIALETDSFDSQLNVVRSTDFLCMLPRKMLCRPRGLTDFIEVASQIAGTSFTVAMFTRPDGEKSKLTTDFMDHLRTALPAVIERAHGTLAEKVLEDV